MFTELMRGMNFGRRLTVNGVEYIIVLADVGTADDMTYHLACALDSDVVVLMAEKIPESRLPTALARADAGRQIDELLDEIGDLEREIMLRPAVTLQDAAVKLRRLSVY